MEGASRFFFGPWSGGVASILRSTVSKSAEDSDAGGWLLGVVRLGIVTEALSTDSSQQRIAALAIRHLAVIPAEIELGDVAV